MVRYFFWKIIRRDLSAEKRKPWFRDHLSNLFIVFWSNLCARDGFRDWMLILRSSAKRIWVRGKLIFEDMSFIATRNRVTLITDPWGTPFWIW